MTLRHNKETYFYALSRLLERASYYGIRSLILLYMIDKGMNMSRADAFQVYGWFTFTFFMSRIIGGLIGDFITGTRNTIIIGGIFQAIGAFTLCIPSTIGLYSGLILIAIGGGFYTTNIIANYGKLYYNKLKLLDSGFTILFQAVSIGTFLGTLYIVRIGELYNWSYGFITAGILALFSIVYPAFHQKVMKRNKV